MEEAKTQILFCSDEELEKRRARVKAFRGPKERKHLLESEYEQIRSIADAMILDGLSDAFTDELLVLAGTPGNERSFDFLRVAALIMGEDYVRSSFFGKVISLDEACRMIREDHHEKQMRPFREIYDHLEEKLTAAREAEEEVNRQIAVLKMQNDHAGEMYQERLESAKAKHQYELEIMQTKAQVTKERLEDKNQSLRESLSKERSEKKDLEKEIEKLKRGGFFSRWRSSSPHVNPDRDMKEQI